MRLIETLRGRSRDKEQVRKMVQQGHVTADDGMARREVTQGGIGHDLWLSVQVVAASVDTVTASKSCRKLKVSCVAT